MQALPLYLKVKLTKRRIRDWINEYGEDGVYVSFSGGKDSTVLLNLVREDYPRVPAVFCDTGLEYPEVRNFVKKHDNVVWLKPKMTFKQVVEKYGYPMISKEVAECVWGARKYLTRVMEEETLDRQTDRQTAHWHNFDKLFETGNYGDNSRREVLRRLIEVRVECLGESEPCLESSRLKTLLTQDYGKTIDNFRVQRLMGILPKKGKATKETIPNKSKKSVYSCSRYQFFLDAPFEIGQQCCRIMKKGPMEKYHKETGRKPITGMMASESRLRRQKWLKQGCNAFDAKKPMSMPMSFWFEQDVLEYIYKNKIEIAPVYGDVVVDYEGMGELDGQMRLDDLSEDFGVFDLERPLYKTTGCDRTGCMFCGFGCHLEKPGEGRFERMKKTHPKQYDYIMRPWSEGGLGYKEVIDWINEHGNLNIKY